MIRPGLIILVLTLFFSVIYGAVNPPVYFNELIANTKKPTTTIVTGSISKDKLKLNLNVTYIKDVYNNINFNFHFQRKIGNSYVSLIKLRDYDYCKFVDSLTGTVKSALLFSQMIKNKHLVPCPLLKGEYLVSNHSIDTSEIARALPGGKFRFTMELANMNDKANYFLMVYTDVSYKYK